MDVAPEVVELIRRTAAGFPWGPARRRYMADTVTTLGLGQRQAYVLFGWGRDTVRKALHELEKEGWVTRVKGKGTFVRDFTVVRAINRIFGFTKNMLEAGRRPSTRNRAR